MPIYSKLHSKSWDNLYKLASRVKSIDIYGSIIISQHIWETIWNFVCSSKNLFTATRRGWSVTFNFGKTRASDRFLSSMFFFKHTFEWFTSKLLTFQICKHYGHFLMKKQIRFHKRPCNRLARQEGVWQL